MKKALPVAVLSLFLVSCAERSSEDTAAHFPSKTGHTTSYFAAPPLTDSDRYQDMSSQTAGAFAVLRGQLHANGGSFTDCVTIKAYVAASGGEIVDVQGFSSEFTRVFGTKLVPNTPHVFQIQVSGFANHDQLVLIEAHCVRPKLSANTR